MSSLDRLEESVLPLISKPSRYLAPRFGGEGGPLDGAQVRICLLAPRTWDATERDPGVTSLFNALLGTHAGLRPEEALGVDICFAPDQDFESLLREEGIPLFGLRSQLPLSRMPVVLGFIQNPLDIPDFLGQLELGGIPILSGDRGDADPVVLIAGQAALNPSLFEGIADGILGGDPEAFAPDLVEWMHRSRRDDWKRPTWLLHAGKLGDASRWLTELPPLPRHSLSPHGAETETALVEIARPRGFADALPLEGPVRSRSLEDAVRGCEALVAATGCGDVVLIGAEHHPDLIPLLEGLNQRLSPHRVTVRPHAVALSTLKPSLARELSKGRRADLSLAPIPVSARLREATGSPLSREGLIQSAETALRGGWRGIRFRMVIGVPGETEADRQEGLEVMTAVAGLGVKKVNQPRLILELVPHSPRPAAGQEGEPVAPESFLATVAAWQEKLPRNRIKTVSGCPYRAQVLAALWGWESPAGSIARDVHRRGLRRQSDPQFFSREAWNPVLKPGAAGHRAPTPMVPGVSVEGPRVDPVIEEGFEIPAWNGGRRPKRSFKGKERKAEKFRLCYSKDERLRFVSHLDVTRGFSRAFRRSQLPVAVSNGKDRRLRVSFGPPLPLGMTSGAEYFDVTFVREVPESFVKIFNESLPEGLAVIGCAPIRTETASLNSAVQLAVYEVSFTDTVISRYMNGIPFDTLMTNLETRLDRVLESQSFEVIRVRGEETRTFNARPSLKRAQVVRDDGGRPVLELALTMNQPNSVRPELFTTTLVDWTDLDERLLRVHRRSQHVPGRDRDLDPLDVVASGFAWWRQPVRGGTVL